MDRGLKGPNTINSACWNALKWLLKGQKKAWVVVLFGCHPIIKVENFLNFSKVSGTAGQENFRLGGWEMWPCDNVGHWFQQFFWCFEVKGGVKWGSKWFDPLLTCNHLSTAISYLFLQYSMYLSHQFLKVSFTRNGGDWWPRMSISQPYRENGSGLPGLAKTIIFKAPLGSTDCSRPFRCC